MLRATTDNDEQIVLEKRVVGSPFASHTVVQHMAHMSESQVRLITRKQHI